jgi:predicted transcriptional regulator
MKRIFKTLILSVATAFLFSCGAQKTNETVFPNQASAACANQSIKNKFVVGWEDGTYSIEHSSLKI